jgi:hypothetical protein
MVQCDYRFISCYCENTLGLKWNKVYDYNENISKFKDLKEIKYNENKLIFDKFNTTDEEIIFEEYSNLYYELKFLLNNNITLNTYVKIGNKYFKPSNFNIEDTSIWDSNKQNNLKKLNNFDYCQPCYNKIWDPNIMDIVPENPLYIFDLDIYGICRVNDCYNLTEIDNNGYNYAVCTECFNEHKKSSLCKKYDCEKKSDNNHLYCSLNCYNLSISDKQEKFARLDKIKIIHLYNAIIDKLRTELYKIKIQVRSITKKKCEYVLNNDKFPSSDNNLSYKLTYKEILSPEDLDIHSICKVPGCFEFTKFDSKGNNCNACHHHYLQNKKNNICINKDCLKNSTSNHLYCSIECSSESLKNKQTELYNLDKTIIINAYNDMIFQLRHELQKTKKIYNCYNQKN